MGIENERERTSSMKDCKHNVLHKPILLKKRQRKEATRKLLKRSEERVKERENISL